MATKKKKKKKKVVRYRRPFYFNIGMVVFLALFLYMGYHIYQSGTGKNASTYEVTTGSIMQKKTFQGIIKREETVVRSPYAGYINYYLREGQKTAVGNLVCTIDETGEMKKLLAENQASGTSSLSDADLLELKNDLNSFSSEFDLMDYSSLYDLRSDMDIALLERINLSTMEALMSTNGITTASYQSIWASKAGIVLYYTDGFEELDSSKINAAAFDTKEYSVSKILPGSMIGVQNVIYKAVTSDDWQIYFPLTYDDIEQFGVKAKVYTIRFIKSGLTMRANYSTFYGTDGELYGCLDLSRYMIQFINERYIEFEILSKDVSGLKIPKTAVTERDFFIIPVDYLMKGGNSGEEGFAVQTLVNGEAKAVFKAVTVYYQDEEYCYVNTDDLNVGDYVVKPDSDEIYLIRSRERLPIVYNLNRGYAVFKLINILAEDGEYYIISAKTSYGLNQFDQIALDASKVENGQIFY